MGPPTEEPAVVISVWLKPAARVDERLSAQTITGVVGIESRATMQVAEGAAIVESTTTASTS
jgi:hypothetical protein